MSPIITNLQGYTVVRNANSCDYPVGLCIRSMLACCEKVLVCDSDSTDGTREMLDRMADIEPRLQVINYPWPNPQGDAKWFTTWLNFARERLTLPFQLQLDADEILDDSPECRQRIREAVEKRQSLTCDRLNYWRSPRFLIPEGHCIGKRVVRVAPSEWWMPSDEGGYKRGDLPILDNAVDATNDVKIHHVGFLRKKDAFYRKARVVLEGFFNTYDKRLEATEAAGKSVSDVQVEWGDKLVPFEGHIPDAVQKWLAERGHDYDQYLPKIEPSADLQIEVIDEKPRGAVHVLHSGDLGDIIAGMAVFKQIGKVRLFVANRGITKPIVERFHLIKDLLLSQPYVETASVYNGEPIHWNASDFRHNYTRETTLVRAHALHFKGTNIRPVEIDESASWLEVVPDQRWAGRVVINRSPRYHNDHFPWQDIVAHYGSLLVFVGHKDEHDAFCRSFGRVPYQPTENLLEAARMIAASALFIGNQSSCLNIAEGLKHPRVQEVCPTRPDCIYPGANSRHVIDGEVTLPNVGGSGELRIRSKLINWKNFDLQIVPKVNGQSGWQFIDQNNVWHCESFVSIVAKKVAKANGWTYDKAYEEVIRYNVLAAPEFFKSRVKISGFDAARKALVASGITDHPIQKALNGTVENLL